MEVSISASALSPSSRGRMFGAGKLSIASACLFAMQLNSHAEDGCTSASLSPRIHSQCRSLYHCSLSTIFFSRLALPCLYLCRIWLAAKTCSLPIGAAMAWKPSIAPVASAPRSAIRRCAYSSAVGRGADCRRRCCSSFVGCSPTLCGASALSCALPRLLNNAITRSPPCVSFWALR